MSDKALLEDTKSVLNYLGNRLAFGCGNHGCVIFSPDVGTNGPCKCRPVDIAVTLSDLAARLKEAKDW